MPPTRSAASATRSLGIPSQLKSIASRRAGRATRAMEPLRLLLTVKAQLCHILFLCDLRHTFDANKRSSSRALDACLSSARCTRRDRHEDHRFCAFGPLGTCRYRGPCKRLRPLERRRRPAFATLSFPWARRFAACGLCPFSSPFSTARSQCADPRRARGRAALLMAHSRLFLPGMLAFSPHPNASRRHVVSAGARARGRLAGSEDHARHAQTCPPSCDDQVMPI